MKRLLYITLFTGLFSYSSISQSSIQCDVPSALMMAYENDVQSLAVEEMLKAGQPDASSIEVIESYTFDIWSALTSAYLDLSAQTDSVFDLFCVHKDFTPYNKYWIYVSVDTQVDWTENWINEQDFSGNSVIDSVLEGHPYQARTPFTPFLPDVIRLEFEEILNLQALAQFLELQPGVVSSERVPLHGDGDKILFHKTGDVASLEFQIGWGDCLSGCTAERSWFYEIDLLNCSVNYNWSWGANVNIDYPGTGQANRVDCNLSTGVGHPLVENQVSIYPNPVTEILSIESENLISKFVISDILGGICASGQVHSREFDINLATHPQGMYLITFYGDQEESFTFKLLKQ